MINHSSMKSENPFVPFSEDGLVDIFFGIGIFFAGFFLRVEMVWMIAILVPVFLPTFQSIRKRVVEPRIGKLVYSTNQYLINLKITLYVSLLIGILVLAGFWVFYLIEFVSFPGIVILRQYILLVLGMIFASLWIFAGAMLRIRRYFLYAALTLFVIMFGQFANLSLWMICVIMGGVITSVGVLILLKLLKKYPYK